ncbi:MAG: hypothetical protein ACPKPY_09740 [Nitrososphaeraceae archaeon]
MRRSTKLNNDDDNKAYVNNASDVNNIYIEIAITSCPVDSCDQCRIIYTNNVLNCRIICKCNCHNSDDIYDLK